MARRNYLDDFTRGRMIGKLEEGVPSPVYLQSSESIKVSFRALESDPNHRRKEADGSQQASLLSNSLQQRGDKCRGLL
ncbi:hypothetical protein TNCV_1836521 [Trichonephila clavipes]|nr:hypothetical protein TNCV_1836521 [Trichonephila clavipes]